jgi:hypothetical protein
VFREEEAGIRFQHGKGVGTGLGKGGNVPDRIGQPKGEVTGLFDTPKVAGARTDAFPIL